MENPRTHDDRVSQFLKSGIYRFQNSTAVFIDPVRVLNRSYIRFRVSPTSYYSRFFEDSNNNSLIRKSPDPSSDSRKRKRKKEKQPRPLNEREQIAQQRHQEVRPLLLRAHETLLEATELLGALRSLRTDGCAEEEEECRESLRKRDGSELNFVELGSVWQAPFYEMSLFHSQDKNTTKDEGFLLVHCGEQKLVPAFNNFVMNEADNDVEAEFLNHKYVIPKKSCFFMIQKDKRTPPPPGAAKQKGEEVENLVFCMAQIESDNGFNLILIDPPWENSSAHQKLKYQTMPNRYFLSLPIKQLTHTVGALVALWVTNREKLRKFVDNELFPTWGIKYAATFYWLKVKADGSLISELDLFHHRPYECLVLGYCHQKDINFDKLSGKNPLPDNQVFISVPGDYSRKPPIGDLLLEYAPGFRQTRCIELFARELSAGWNCWGNEPLHFQDTKYFIGKEER